MNGISFMSFYDRIKKSEVLDGDLVIQRNGGEAKLVKVNFGGSVARKMLGAFSNRTTMATAEQNREVRAAFRESIRKLLTDLHYTDNDIAAILNRVDERIGTNDDKPLSRRDIYAVCQMLSPSHMTGTGPTRQMGSGGNRLTLTKRQFNGMLEQAQHLAEKRKISDADYLRVLRWATGNGPEDNFISKDDFLKDMRRLKNMVDSGDFPQARAMFGDRRRMPAENERKAFADLRRQTAQILLREAISSSQFATLKTMVTQSKRNYELGQLRTEVSTLLTEGHDTASLRDMLIGKAKANVFFAPRTVSYAWKPEAYSKHKLHAASKDVCEAIDALEQFEEANEPGEVEKIVKFEPGSLGKAPEGGNGELLQMQRFWSEFLISENPLETEISQLSGGERLGRVLVKEENIVFLRNMCALAARGERVQPCYALLGEGAQGASQLGTALTKLCETLNKKLFTSKGPDGRPVFKFDANKLRNNPETLFKAVAEAKVEDAITEQLRRIAEETAVTPILRTLGLTGRDLSAKNKMLKMFISTTFAKASPVVLRQLFASGFRNARNNELFDPMATLFAAGPLTQKMLQGFDTSSLNDADKKVLEEMCDIMPPIPEKVVRAALFDIVQKSRSRGGQPIKSIEVKETLGSATVGQTFLCTVNFDDGNGGVTPRKCVLKLERPGVSETFAQEAKHFRKAIGEFGGANATAADRKLAKEINSAFTQTVQMIKQEMSLEDELANTIRGIRAYACEGGDAQEAGIDSMLPLLKKQTPEFKSQFIAAVKGAARLDAATIRRLIEDYCVGTSGSALLLTCVEGDTLLKFTRAEKNKFKDGGAELLQTVATEKNDFSQLAKEALMPNPPDEKYNIDNVNNKSVVINAQDLQVNNGNGPDQVYGVGSYPPAGEVLKKHRENLKKVIGQARANVQEMWRPVKEAQVNLQKALEKLADRLVNGKPPFLHGDSHGGNIMRTPEKRIPSAENPDVVRLEKSVLVFIDYGRGMEISEKTSHALARLLAVGARPDFNLSEVAIDAYRVIIDEAVRSRQEALLNSGDPNDRAELELLQETQRRLDDPRLFSQLILDVQKTFTSGDNAMDRIANFCNFLSREGLSVPPALQTFCDTVVKTFNVHRELDQVTTGYKKVSNDSQVLAATNYLNAVVQELSKLKSPVIGKNGANKDLFPTLSANVTFTPESLGRLKVLEEEGGTKIVDAHTGMEVNFMAFIRGLPNNAEFHNAQEQIEVQADFSEKFYSSNKDLDEGADYHSYESAEMDDDDAFHRRFYGSGDLDENFKSAGPSEAEEVVHVAQDELAEESELLKYHTQHLADLIVTVVRDLNLAKENQNQESSLFLSQGQVEAGFNAGAVETGATQQKIDAIILPKARAPFSDIPNNRTSGDRLLEGACTAQEDRAVDLATMDSLIRNVMRRVRLSKKNLPVDETSIRTAVNGFWQNYKQLMSALVEKARQAIANQDAQNDDLYDKIRLDDEDRCDEFADTINDINDVDEAKLHFWRFLGESDRLNSFDVMSRVLTQVL